MKKLTLGTNHSKSNLEGFEHMSKISKISPGKGDMLLEHIDEIDEDEAL